ncbi:MAG TPA: deoxyribonuclease IV [Vicinamibacterales bacterium]|nr:deoxyribonuclease IV [Vicinamibacterales bacterium]
MPRLGAHMSVAGGLPAAIARARIHQCDTLQVFTKNASQWRARPLPPTEIAAFKQAARETGISPIVAHASYLINLATINPALRAQSIAALGEEVDRAEALGLLGVVLHPGARMTAPVDQAISLIVDALAHVLKDRQSGKTMILLEHTAGQGSTMGSSFEEIAAMLDGVTDTTRMGVCLDTCHLLASGYNLCTDEGYRATFDSFERLIGVDRLKVFHLNDSKKPCMSRVDRHEHIGKGCIGLEPFRRLLNDPRFAHLPMILETEKTDSRDRGRIEIDPLDEMNLNALRGLLANT